MHQAKILIVVLNFLVIGILSLVFINLITIPLISPGNGLYTTERKPEFVWGGMQREFVIFLDDDPNFKTALTERVFGNSYRLREDLDFGTYYWKLESAGIMSEIRKFTIGSNVVLARNESEVKNEGNVNLLLHRITGAFVLNVNESLEVGEDENVKAEQG